MYPPAFLIIPTALYLGIFFLRQKAFTDRGSAVAAAALMPLGTAVYLFNNLVPIAKSVWIPLMLFSGGSWTAGGIAAWLAFRTSTLSNKGLLGALSLGVSGLVFSLSFGVLFLLLFGANLN